MRSVTWYLTGSPNPYAVAVEPGAAGIDIPRSVLDWASGLGLGEADPDVYLLVTTAEDPGEVIGLIRALDGEVSDQDASRIDQALTEQAAERRQPHPEPDGEGWS